MGMYATVRVDSEVELPHFPESINVEDLVWQSKQGIDVYSGPYRITSEGRLERKQKSRREKTEEEKEQEAKKWGFQSWDEYVKAYENTDAGELYPPEIDAEEETPPTFSPSESTVDEVWWSDYNMHGTFEFHQIIHRDPIEFETITVEGQEEVRRPVEYKLDVFLQYEARFTRGQLDEIVFIGDRSGDDTRNETIEKIQAWEQNT